MTMSWHRVLFCVLTVVAVIGCGSGEGRRRAGRACQTAAECALTEDGGTPAPCVVPTCVDSQCATAPAPDGTACDDGDPGTSGDACSAGVCKGTEKPCVPPPGPCETTSIDPATGACVARAKADGDACDDGNLCTQADSCTSGKCVGGAPRGCAATDGCHVAGTCDPKTGDCGNPAAPDGTGCDDARYCTKGDVCTAGACAGTAVTCDDGRSCSADACDEALRGCHSDVTGCACRVDGDCNDGNGCNGVETCNVETSQCVTGNPLDCGALTDGCHTGTCDPATGACAATPVANGMACNDGDQCTRSDTCQNGTCTGTDPVACGSPGQCKGGDVCDPATGSCVAGDKPDGAACDDANPCTKKDTCQAGACAGQTVICTAADQCHVAGTCSPATGLCSSPIQANGTGCDDGNLCTQSDVCTNGACASGTAISCAGSDACHLPGACDPTTGICSNPPSANGASCDDGLLCTQSDQCSGGACKGTTLSCTDGRSCTVDSCSEVLGGCTFDASKCACAMDSDCNDGNPCNGTETCNAAAGLCTTGTPKSCAIEDDVCNVGSCNPVNGACVKMPKASGTVCNDGNFCTKTDSCQAGVCVGNSPVVCAAGDPCHNPGTCDPSTGACSNPPKPDGATCTDGNACTQTDTCQSGSCLGQNPVACAALDGCHTAGTCDAKTGACSNPLKPDSFPCSDGSACTKGDVCLAGSCNPGTPTVCAAQDQCHAVGTCNPTTGACSNPARADGAPCTDGTACTKVDSCQNGTCTGASPVTCTAQDQCHAVGTCDSATGTCSNPALANGTPCTDGNACTRSDTCQNAACAPGAPVVCPIPDQCHSAGTCDSTSGLCSSPQKPDGSTCNDGLTCTTPDSCTSGVCGGAARVCNDGIACTLDSCTEAAGGCTTNTSACGCTKNSDCDDGNACNGTETCNLAALTCQSGTAVNCGSLTNVCNIGTCNPANGACTAVPRAPGTTCNDNNACTTVDSCQNGTCTGASPVVCAAQDQCHTGGVCDSGTGSCSNPPKANNSPCTDGSACTTVDTCQNGACTGASPVVCTALDACHGVGTCNPGTGSCSNPLASDGTPCTDGNACTRSDSCSAGVCIGTNPVTCTPQDSCHTAGTCDTSLGTCGNPAKIDGSTCNDSNLCTTPDTCKAGLCSGILAVTCTALSQCHDVGVCASATGTCSNPPKLAGSPCNDSNACTQNDACNGSGSCSINSPVSCLTTLNPCKVTSCFPATGCQTNDRPDGTACTDGNQCTRSDACLKGTCTGTNRDDKNGDWADAPGGEGSGPRTIDLMSFKGGTLAAVGVYTGNTAIFGGQALAFDPKLAQALYLAVYDEMGVGGNGQSLLRVGIGGVGFNVQGVPGTIGVAGAAMHPDDTFSIVGVFNGPAHFGTSGSTIDIASNWQTMYVAHYAPDGKILWVATGDPGDTGMVTGEVVSAFEDGSVVVSGINGADVTVTDALGNTKIVPTGGVYAARFLSDGSMVFARRVAAKSALRGSNIGVRAVTTHSDGSFTLLGAFISQCTFGPGDEKSQTPQGGADAWLLRLESDATFRWTGRIGGTTGDRAGDVQGVDSDDVVVAIDASGATPTLDVAGNLVSLHTVSGGSTETDLVRIDPSGKPLVASFIGEAKGTSQGWDLGYGKDKSITLTGVYNVPMGFYDEVGFGIGAPPGTPIALPNVGQTNTIYVSRYEPTFKRRWTISAGGANSGMLTQAGWDLLLAVHPSLSVTVGGMFQGQSIFGNALQKTLISANKAGSPFVVHMNSEQALDYCP
jgi:hypothetical protein